MHHRGGAHRRPAALRRLVPLLLLLAAALAPASAQSQAIASARGGRESALKSFRDYKHGQERGQSKTNHTLYLMLMETGSVGSSWLTHVLDSHPNIVSMGERTTQVLGLEHALRQPKGITSGALQAVGIKVKRDRLRGRSPMGKFYDETGQVAYGRHNDTIPVLLNMLRRNRAKLVCLYRRNFVKHAVSQVRHHQQAKIGCGWETTKDECVKKLARLPLTNFKSLSQYIELLEMDVNDTLAICDEFAGRNQDLPEAYARAYAYEDLVYGDRTREHLADLQEFLNVDPIDIVDHYNEGVKTIKKVTPVDLASYLVNYDEVDDYVKTRYGRDSREYRLFTSTAD